MKQDEIKERVMGFYDEMSKDPNHRYKSWEHCYLYFNQKSNLDNDTACLQLAFYLASWGMYRGSSFLLQKDYLFLKPVVEILLEEENRNISLNDKDYAEKVISLGKKITNVLKIQDMEEERFATSTLVTKIILGTLGVVPAYDQYFKGGLRINGQITQLYGKTSLEGLQKFVGDNDQELKSTQDAIRKSSKSRVQYPIMRIVDMYFWQIGDEEGREKKQGYLQKSKS